MSLNSQDEKVDIHQKESASFEESHVDTAFERATMYVLVVLPHLCSHADLPLLSRKIDLRLLPILGALYSVALIDR
jgi:hypothetical protein